MTETATDPSAEARVCPTCGSRVTPDASRCLVCGTDLHPRSLGGRGRRGLQVSLSLPIALLLLAFFSLISAGLTFAAFRFTGIGGPPATPTATETPTPTLTLTPTATSTEAPTPTATPLPPIEYRVAQGDTCAVLAGFYKVSVRSIIELNGLGTECLLTVGMVLNIPQPTPTPLPPPTATLSPAEATAAACSSISYTVEENDALSSIALNYNVSMQAIKDYNGLTSDTVFSGQILIIPLCERITSGPTPTATPPPPYPAPNLLLPQDGASFTLSNDSIPLQWAVVGELRENEFYQVTVEDITEGSGRQKIVDYVKDTKYVVPTGLRPQESIAHIFRWWVVAVRQVGSDSDDEPRYSMAGSASLMRYFSWTGAAPGATPTP